MGHWPLLSIRDVPQPHIDKGDVRIAGVGVPDWHIVGPAISVPGPAILVQSLLRKAPIPITPRRLADVGVEGEGDVGLGDGLSDRRSKSHIDGQGALFAARGGEESAVQIKSRRHQNRSRRQRVLEVKWRGWGVIGHVIVRRQPALAGRGRSGIARVPGGPQCDRCQSQRVLSIRHRDHSAVEADDVVEGGDGQVVVLKEVERDPVVVLRNVRNGPIASGARALVSRGGGENVHGFIIDFHLDIVDARVLAGVGTQEVNLDFRNDITRRSLVHEDQTVSVPVGFVGALDRKVRKINSKKKWFFKIWKYRIFPICSTLAAKWNSSSEIKGRLIRIPAWAVRRRDRWRGWGRGRGLRFIAIRRHTGVPTAIVRRPLARRLVDANEAASCPLRDRARVCRRTHGHTPHQSEGHTPSHHNCRHQTDLPFMDRCYSTQMATRHLEHSWRVLRPVTDKGEFCGWI